MFTAAMSDTVLNLGLATMAVLGMWLLVRGLCARREGGNRRRRRYAIAILGLLLSSLPVAVLIGPAVRSVDWYAYKPEVLLLHDARSADASLSAKAYKELNRRVWAGELGVSAASEVADTAIAECSREPSRAAEYAACEIVYALQTHGYLTRNQIARFYDGRLSLSMRARPQAVLEDGIPVALSERWRAMPAQCRMGYLYVSIVDGADAAVPLPVPPGPTGRIRTIGENERMASDVLAKDAYPVVCPYRGPGGMSEGVWRVQVDRPGRQRLEFVVSATVVDALSDQENSLYEYRKHFTVESSVSTHAPPGFVRLVDTPDLAPRVRDCISVSTEDREGDIIGPHLLVRMRVSDPPVPLAFDVVVEIAGQRLDEGHFWMSPACREGAYAFMIRHHEVESAFDRFNIILTPNPVLARRTVDIAEIWGLPIVMEDVPVAWRSQMPARPATSTAGGGGS